MIRKSLVLVAISLLLAGITSEATATPVQQHDITAREYWVARGYEVVSDMWCAGENTMVQLYKDHDVITINYEEQRVSSCRGSYDGCFVDYIDEVEVLYSEE